MKILVGENIKRLRKQYNLTQEVLSDIFKVSTAAISKWESGESFPDITLIPEIASFFNISIDELMGYNEAKMEEEINEIIRKYNEIPNSEKYNGKCDLINSARKKYPHNYKIAILYLYDIIGGYTENDPSLLISNSIEILKTVDEIKKYCTDVNIKIEAMFLEAKVLKVMGKLNEAIAVINKIPSIYLTSNRFMEQLYDKGTDEYYEILTNNAIEIGEWFGDKIAKMVIYKKELSFDEKKEILDDIEFTMKSLYEKTKLIGLKAFYDQLSKRNKTIE